MWSLIGVRRAAAAGAMVLLLLLAACAPAPAGRIELSTTDIDFGTTSSTEPITEAFTVRNAGSEVLEITGISTSCSCTTAEVGAERLEPGETTQLLVTFDPLTHNSAIGEFMRQVFIESTDPDTPNAVFTFRVTVVES